MGVVLVIATPRIDLQASFFAELVAGVADEGVMLVVSRLLRMALPTVLKILRFLGASTADFSFVAAGVDFRVT